MRILIIVSVLLFTTQVNAQKLPYTNHTEAGLLAGNGVNPSFTFQTFNGVRIQKWKFEAGLTTGVDIYSQMIILPLSAGVKWNPFNTKAISPFVSVNAGYGFAWLQRPSDNLNYSGGYMFNPSVGLRIKTKKDAAKLNLSLGFRQQRAVTRQTSEFYLYDYIGGSPDIETQDEYTFRRISLTLGLSL